jgi:large subunit ribosomal protein L18
MAGSDSGLQEWQGMGNKVEKISASERRKRRSRGAVRGTPERPRLCVVRTLRHVYVQVIDDQNGTTLAAVSTLSPELKGQLTRTWGKEAAQAIGKLVASKAKEKGITKVVFDRGGTRYHGRMKALADAAREAGLVF